eukprot:COSAG02_NODE_25905_length_646_cov_0.502742_2_plen_40_part_01
MNIVEPTHIIIVTGYQLLLPDFRTSGMVYANTTSIGYTK